MREQSTEPDAERTGNDAAAAQGAASALLGIGTLVALALWAAPGPPYYAVLGPPGDRFADYFKFVLSYPGGAGVDPGSLFGLRELIAGYQAHNPYQGAANLAGATCTHLHAPPLMTLFCLANLLAMRIVQPELCFAIVVFGLLAAWTTIAVRVSHNRREGMYWWLAGLASYPFLFMVARGNVYAGTTALALVAALLLSANRRYPIAVALLLACAINFRPNAILFLPAALVLDPKAWARTLGAFAVAAGAIFGACLLAAHALYPGYTLASFREGLRIYYAGYVVGDGGLAFGSSLYGAIKLLVGYRPGLDLVAMVPAIAILVAGLALGVARAIRPGALTFLVAAAYCLGSSVIADYHLFVFIAPAMLAARDLRRSDSVDADRIAFGTSCLMLVPLNYGFRDGISWQVVLHPLVLLIAAIAIVGPATETVRTRRRRLDHPPMRLEEHRS